MTRPLDENWPLSPAFSLKACALIVLSGILVYGNHLHNAFQFDTVGFIANNPLLKNPQVMLTFDYWLTHIDSRGLLQSSLAFNYLIGEFQPFGYHIVNLILHLLNTILIFFISWKACRYFKVNLEGLGREQMQSVSLFTALLFLLHPIQTESVVYVISRSEVLAATFYLSALYLFQSLLERTKISWAQSLVWTCVLAILFILGFGVKQTLASLPLVLFLYYLCGCQSDSRLRIFMNRWKWWLGLIVVLASGALAWKLFTDEQFLIGPSEAGEIIGRKNYLLSQPGVILFYYLKLLFLPFNLNIDPDIATETQLFSIRFWVSLSFFLALLWAAFRYAGTRIYFFLACWFFIVLSPSSSIVTLHDLAAEHRVYLASYAFYFALILGMARWSAQGHCVSKWARGMPLVALIFLGTATMDRNTLWADEVSLWEDTHEKSPHKVRPLINLARAYSLTGKSALAIRYYEEALTYMPYDFVANFNLGDLYLKQGLTEKALELFHRAYQSDSHIAEAPAKLGEIYLQLQDFEKAERYLRQAVELDPGSAVAFRNLGIVAYFHLGKPQEGIAFFRQSLTLDPEQADVESIRALIRSGNLGRP